MNANETKINNFIKDKNIPVCQLCTHNEWGVSSKIFQLLEFDANGLTIGGATYPVIPITCNHCGNTLFVNAIVAGLIDTTGNTGIEKKG